jgi:hypothetical protein
MGQKQGTYHMFGRHIPQPISQFGTVTAQDQQSSSQPSPRSEVAVLWLDCALGPNGHQSSWSRA